MNSQTKTRVRNSCIPRYEDDAAQKKAVQELVERKPIVFSHFDALTFVPGERELNAAGYKARKLKKEGKIKEARAALAKAMELLELEEAEEESED